MRYAPMETWRSPATIPNVDGYKILCLTTSGGLRTETVVRDDDGNHRLSRTPIANVRGWLPDQSNAEDAAGKETANDSDR